MATPASVIAGVAPAAISSGTSTATQPKYREEHSQERPTVNPSETTAGNITQYQKSAGKAKEAIPPTIQQLMNQDSVAAKIWEQAGGDVDKFATGYQANQAILLQGLKEKVDGYEQEIAENSRKAVIDPQNWLRDPGENGNPGEVSLSRKTLAVIGLALGGIAAGMTGGENQAQKVLQAAIDRDIQAQKDTFAMRMKGLIEAKDAVLSNMDTVKLNSLILASATNSVLSGAKAAVEGVASKKQEIMENPLAQALMAQIDEKKLQNVSNAEQLFLGLDRAGNQAYMTAVEYYLGSTVHENPMEAFSDNVPRDLLSPRPEAANRYTLFPKAYDKAAGIAGKAVEKGKKAAARNFGVTVGER